MGMGRNEQSDPGRRGAPSHGKDTDSYQYNMPAPKGHWLRAYGGQGAVSDPDVGTVDDEVGNDAD